MVGFSVGVAAGTCVGIIVGFSVGVATGTCVGIMLGVSDDNILKLPIM